jgi:hypothetical protein
MIGEAMAAPIDNANHTSTKRASWRAWRTNGMRVIIGTSIQYEKREKRGKNLFNCH